MGARFEYRDSGVHFEALDTPLVAPEDALDCGNSGTTLRLMIGQAARLNSPISLTGDASLRGRPNGDLLDLLKMGGVEVRSVRGAPRRGDRPPFAWAVRPGRPGFKPVRIECVVRFGVCRWRE